MSCAFLLTAFAAFCIKVISASGTKQYTGQPCPVVLPAASSGTQPERIVNGTAPTGDLEQHMVQLAWDLGSICSGSLLSDYWVLTAAHCNVMPALYFAIVGGQTFSDGVRIEILQTITHPSFDESTWRDDIALVLLAAPAPVGSKFVLVNSVSSIPADYAFVRVAGYGRTQGTNFLEEGKLLEVDVPTAPTDICSAQMTAQGSPSLVLSSYHLCAGYEQGGCDSCQGDSGGPLFLFDTNESIVQVGITSYGIGCSNPKSPGVYTRLSRYISWMLQNGADFETSADGQNVFLETPKPSAPSEPTEAAEPSAPSGPSPSMQTSSDTSSGFFEGCFAANARVALLNGSTKTMEELLIGDLVQVSPGLYSEVFVFTHRVSSGMSEFIYLYSNFSDAPLTITAGHFLPVNGDMTEAKNARVGDTIELGKGGIAEITRLDFRKGRGMYSPQTLDGRIVVDGVVASTYTRAIEMGAAHALLTPLRYLFQIFGRTDVSFGVLEKAWW